MNAVFKDLRETFLFFCLRTVLGGVVMLAELLRFGELEKRAIINGLRFRLKLEEGPAS